MNIIWKQPDDTLAITYLLDDSIDLQEHAKWLKEAGNIDSTWEAIAFNVQSVPEEAQETWRYINGNIVAPVEIVLQHKREKYPALSAFQVRKVLTQFNLRNKVESAISQSDQNIKDAWQFANEFNRLDPMLVYMAQALGITDEQLDSMFEIGLTL